MRKKVNVTANSPDTIKTKNLETTSSKNTKAEEAFAELTRGVHAALETYSNVHRGSGYNSMVSTHLFEQARDIVLGYQGLNKGKYVVIFCSPRYAEILESQLKTKNYQIISSEDIGLRLGVRAVAVERKALPKGTPSQTGGGTANLVSPDRVSWAQVPDRFEAGTPAIINVIAFAKALQLIQMLGNDVFLSITTEKIMATQILHNDDLKEYSGQELLNKLRHTLIGKDIRVPTAEGLKPYINFDNGASTPTFKPIWDVVWQIWRQPMQVKQGIIPEVKSVCANALGAPEEVYDIIFTSNTTESINLLAASLSTKSDEGIETVVINTILEHNSNELPWRMMPGCSQIRLSIDSEGFIDLDELESLLSTYNQKNLYGKKRIKLVAISGASNVLGTFNDLSEICRITHLYGAQVLVDGAQLVAHRKIEMEKCGIDYLAFSAHKVYAPFGTGVLIARKGLLNFSSSEIEKIKSSGEENIGGIAALGKALILLQRIGFDLIKDEEQALTARALCGITQIPGVTVYGIKNKESPRFDKKSGVIVFDLKGIFANTVAKELAKQGGIGVRYGCHCAHMLVKHLVKIPPIVERIQHLIVSLFPQLKLPGITRVSFGIENSEEDVDTFIYVLNNIAKKSKDIVNRKVTSTDIKQQMDDSVKITTQRVYHQLS